MNRFELELKKLNIKLLNGPIVLTYDPSSQINQNPSEYPKTVGLLL